MIPEFKFLGFNPTESLMEKANIALDRLLEMAPQGSIAVALLEKDDLSFCCAIELYSKQGPFTARGYDKRAEVALNNVTKSLSKKLDQWNGVRTIPQKGENKRLPSEERTSNTALPILF